MIGVKVNIKKGFILVLFVVISFFLSAQSNSKINNQEVDSILELSFQSYKTLDTELSLKYSLEALELSKLQNYPYGEAVSYFYMGSVMFSLGNYEKVLEYLALAEKLDSKDLILQFEIKRVKGRTYTYLGLQDAALNEFNLILKDVRIVEDEWKRNFLRALAYENIAYLYEMQERADSALNNINKSYEILQLMDENLVFVNLINSCTLIGKFYYQEKKYDLAERSFDCALKLAEKYSYPYRSMTLMVSGDMEKSRDDKKSALAYYLEALDNLEETKLKEEYPSVYERLSEIYYDIGDSVTAQTYKEKMLLIEKELSGEKIRSSAKALEILLAEQKMRETRKYNLILISVIIILFLTGVVGFLIFRWKREKHLRAKKQEIVTLETKLNESFDEVVSLAKANSPQFLTRFQEVYPELIQNLQSRHPDISSSELTFCALISLNFSSKEIAEFTFVQHRSVQTRKTRLRKKLNLPSGADLNRYFNSLS